MIITRLHDSDVTTPPSHPTPGKRLAIYVYVVISPGGVVLFDTGLGPPHERVDAIFQPRRWPLLELLEEAGVAPADVGVIVNCHLHLDHCGGNRLFPHARIVVQRPELEATRTPRYTLSEWVEYEGARYDVVEGETQIGPGVRAVPTPGHTPGHQSLIVDGPEGRVILAGQVSESAAGFGAGTGSWTEGLEAEGAASVARLKAMSPARVLFAHDDVEWTPAVVAR